MITPRDIDFFLKPIALFGKLTTKQLSRYSGINLKICQRRGRILTKDSCLERMAIFTQTGQAPLLYYLGDKGARIVGIKPSKPRLNVRFSHSLKNSDILIEIKLAFKDSKIKCDLFPESRIRSFQQGFIPDGSFCLEKDNKSALFLVENCSGTEAITSTKSTNIESKLATYSTFFENNDIEIYNYFFQKKFKRFRLLFMANNHQRLRSISKLSETYDQYGFFYITTIKEFEKKGINSDIWRIPAKKLVKQGIV